MIFSFSVSQLREHWEDTSTKVMSRRNQIDELLVDNQQVILNEIRSRIISNGSKNKGAYPQSNINN